MFVWTENSEDVKKSLFDWKNFLARVKKLLHLQHGKAITKTFPDSISFEKTRSYLAFSQDVDFLSSAKQSFQMICKQLLTELFLQSTSFQNKGNVSVHAFMLQAVVRNLLDLSNKNRVYYENMI